MVILKVHGHFGKNTIGIRKGGYMNKEIICPNCSQRIKILDTIGYDLYLENLKKEEREIERLKAIVEGTKENRNELQEEIKRLKEEYIILQNASDEVEEEKDKEIERLNTNLEVANEDLIKIAQLLNLEEGCTIYDIEDKIERLNNTIEKAIEYIEIYNEEENPDYGSSFINKNDYSYVLFDEYRESLLNILRGEDNE